MNKKSLCLAVCLLIFSASIAVANPKAAEIMRDLKQTPLQQHKPIYERILEDTSVLAHGGLRQEIHRVARDIWYKRHWKGNYARKLRETFVDSWKFDARPIDFSDVEHPWLLHKRFLEVSQQLDGRSFIKVALWNLTHPRSDLNNYQKKLILHGPNVVKIWLQRVSYKDNQNRGSHNTQKFDKRDYRLISSMSTLSRPLYEIIRRYWDVMNPGLQKRVKRFSLNTLSDPKSGLKSFATAALLFVGKDSSEISKRMKVRKVRKRKFGEIEIFSKKRVKNGKIHVAKIWQEKYPKWPVDESNIDNDSHKNDQGKGHDKQKGQGHR